MATATIQFPEGQNARAGGKIKLKIRYTGSHTESFLCRVEPSVRFNVRARLLMRVSSFLRAFLRCECPFSSTRGVLISWSSEDFHFRGKIVCDWTVVQKIDLIS
jgi:hypothetical protein